MKIEKPIIIKNRRPIGLYFLVGLLALSIKIYFNFSQDLIPGVNGGYYPLQVRTVLEHGHLGFSDMPLLFYVDAYIIKFLNFFDINCTDTLIINVVKFIDCLFIPLLLIPLYKIISNVNTTLSQPYEIGLLCFSVLSFSPLILTSDLQKNALAILFLFCFLDYSLSYLNNKIKRQLFYALIFSILTGLTHFGTFCFLLFYLLLFLIFTSKMKALLPFVALLSVGLALIGIFDITRLKRLFNIGSLAFERPALTNGMIAPPEIIIILISWFFAILILKILLQNKDTIIQHQKGILFANCISLIVFSFPLLEVEYFKRLSLFLFIPQVLSLLLIYPYISKKLASIVYFSVFSLTALSVIANLGHKKETVINEQEYLDLKQLQLKPDDKTIVVARHGLEWWVAWALKVKVGQEKAMTPDIYTKYSTIFILHQQNNKSKTNQPNPFQEPSLPPTAEIINSSKYFKIYKFKASGLQPKNKFD